MVAGTQDELFNSSFTKLELDGDFKSPAATPQPEVLKSVTFSHENEIFEIPHIDDMSDEEIDSIWMSPEDFKAIRRECRDIVVAIERNNNKCCDGIELRGLERHLSSQRKRTEVVRDMLYDTVGKIQDFQDETQIDVSDMMVTMCERISSRSVDIATQMAMRDEVDARS